MKIGDVVMGRYRITHVLARGGMGEVYLARLEGAEGFVRPAVIKRILPVFSSDEEMVRMFVREARLLADLRHPSIVSVLDFASEGDGHLMALEYVHGYSVQHWANFLKNTSREIPTWVAVWIIIEVLDALHYAHTRTDDATGASLGIIHRDVSPSNVLIDAEGHVRLLDFGVARELGQHTAPEGGQVNLRGKFPYLAPELFDGAMPGPETDLYACAVLLHELLVGENEFRRRDPHKTIRRVLIHDLSPPSASRADVPPELDAVIAKAVAKEREERHTSASELADALRELLPLREKELREQLRKSARADFFGGLPAALSLESLESLERAWKTRPDEVILAVTLDPPPPSDATEVAPLVERSPEPRPHGLLFAAVGAALVLSGVGVYVALTASSGPERIVIVERRLGDERGGDPEAPDESPEALAPGDASAELAEDAAVESTGRRRRTPQTRVARLSASFNRRRGQLRACFVRHTQSLSGTPQISVRFQVRADGSVESAQLSPPALAATPLGGCLRGVALSTEFGRQPAAAAFHIPISVRGD